MRTATIELYSFEELTDDAKEKARDWWRNCEAQDWHGAEHIFEDAQRVAEILGITFADRNIKLMNGSTRTEPAIYYSGFSCQGDGASFEGSYAYKAGSCKAIREYAPEDKTLHSIADGLRDIQRPFFYQLEASCRHAGYYMHSGCMQVSVGHPERWLDDDTETSITDELRAFADWIYRQLEAEYEHSMSDENVDENIRANEYEFTADGSIN